jgi:hypothetical protein
MTNKIEKAYKEIFDICKGKKWQMSVPVNKERDSDCIIIDGIKFSYLDGYTKAMQDVKDNGMIKDGNVTIPLTLLNKLIEIQKEVK